MEHKKNTKYDNTLTKQMQLRQNYPQKYDYKAWESICLKVIQFFLLIFDKTVAVTEACDSYLQIEGSLLQGLTRRVQVTVQFFA